MIEIQLINNLLRKKNYSKYREYLKPSKEVEQYYECLDKLHSSLDRDISLEEFTAMCPDFPVPTTFFSDDIINIKLGDIKQRQWAYDHAILSVDIAEGRKTLDHLLTHIEKLDRQVVKDEYHTTKLSEVYESRKSTPSIAFRLPQLQRATGGLRKGNFGFIFARPETGKTTFLASEVTHMASQVDGVVLWINNEEEGGKVLERMYQGALGWTVDQLKVDWNRADELFLKLTKNNIVYKDASVITRHQIDQMCKTLNPSLILVDQLDKVVGFHDDRRDTQLGKLYTWAREIAKEYCPFIGVTQASASAEGKMWLQMDDIADSKTSKAAEADLIIGIGKKNQEGYENLRGLHLIKNKLTGDHARIECRIKPEIGRYEQF